MDLTNKKIMIISFSNNGALLSTKIEKELNGVINNYSFYKYADNYHLKPFNKVKDLLTTEFNNNDFIIFIGAVGIAVREIAPFIKNKMVDPGVVVIDELGKYTISLLSGHIGLANMFTKFLAKRLNSQPIITTATDINNRFSIDEWATINNLKIDNMNTFKEIAGVIINNNIGFKSDFSYEGSLPNGLEVNDNLDEGVYITYKNLNPFKKTLKLIPKVLSVGVGCKKGTSASLIEDAINLVFKENSLLISSIKSISSIDLKKDEEGIIEYAKKINVPFNYYSKEELLKLDGDFSKSDFVLKTVGVDCVCERAAKISSTGSIIVRKKAINGVTVSVALDKYIIKF